MPTMPYVVGVNFQEAQSLLRIAGVYKPSAIGYFGTDPISADWMSSTYPPGTVLAQSIAAGSVVSVNSTLALYVARFPFGVAEQSVRIVAPYVKNNLGNLVTNPQGLPVIS